jgi:DNA-binding NarL/FixJ family response regulator
MVVQVIDMLPYGNQYISKMTTYVPIMHNNGEVVAIQASTIETYILRFQGHIDNPNISTYDKNSYEQFSAREREILFLICNGAAQEHIAKILKIARGTVSSIIHHQLCPKFAIDGSNMKELMKKAIQAGMSRTLPEGLWHPCIIVLNRDLLEDPNLNELER